MNNIDLIINKFLKVMVVIATGCALGEFIVNWKKPVIATAFALITILCLMILYILYRESKTSN